MGPDDPEEALLQVSLTLPGSLGQWRHVLLVTLAEEQDSSENKQGLSLYSYIIGQSKIYGLAQTSEGATVRSHGMGSKW